MPGTFVPPGGQRPGQAGFSPAMIARNLLGSLSELGLLSEHVIRNPFSRP
jgi:hypothetical protein